MDNNKIFICKINILSNTYTYKWIGGINNDYCMEIASDINYNLYLSGYTYSSLIYVNTTQYNTGFVVSTYPIGFVIKLNSNNL